MQPKLTHVKPLQFMPFAIFLNITTYVIRRHSLWEWSLIMKNFWNTECKLYSNTVTFNYCHRRAVGNGGAKGPGPQKIWKVIEMGSKLKVLENVLQSDLMSVRSPSKNLHGLPMTTLTIQENIRVRSIIEVTSRVRKYKEFVYQTL